jgi:hypothetical protein
MRCAIVSLLLCAASFAPALRAAPSAEQTVLAFQHWAETRALGKGEGADEALGARLAADRRAAMRELIVSDPARAYALALPETLREGLPKSLAEGIERRIDGMGILTTLVRMYHDETARHAQHAPLEMDGTGGAFEPFHRAEHVPAAVIDGEGFKLHTWGRRADLKTLLPVPIHGIAVDHLIAVSPDATRLLDSVEVARMTGLAASLPTCGGGEFGGEGSVRHVGDGIARFCSQLAVDAHETEQARTEEQGRGGRWLRGKAAPARTPAKNSPQSAYTTGAKTFLFVNARFPDQTTNFPTVAAAQSQMNATRDYMRQFSYGAFSELTTTVIEVTLPKTTAEYNAVPNDGGDMTLYTDARAAAIAAGQDPSRYNFWGVRYNGGPGGFAGQAWVGSPGMWLRSGSASVATHELGHNVGVLHANFWNASGPDPLGVGSNQEYGNGFDVMGGGGSTNAHFTASAKEILTWLTPERYTQIWGSGTYRIQSQDVQLLPATGLLAARYPRERLWMESTTATSPQSGLYWFEHRNLLSQFGQSLHVNLQGGQNWLLDLTRGSRDGKNDGGLWLGRTHSDRQLGLHVTPVAKIAGTPPSFDLVVNSGAFPGNRAPIASVSASAMAVAINTSVSFTASASDPDGDALAYFWSYGDGTFGGNNQATTTRSYASAGVYPVQVIVSDMKGRESVATVLVTVGAPTTHSLRGRLVAGSAGVPGVLVGNGQTGGNFRGAFSDANGDYVIGNVASGNVTLTAYAPGYSSTPTFANPVVVAGAVTGLDFALVSLPEVSIEATDAAGSFTSGDPVSFRISRRTVGAAPLTVYFRRAGTAFMGSEYTLSANVTGFSVVIPAGATEATVTATPLTTNAATRPPRTLVLALADGSDYRVLHPSYALATLVGGLARPANDQFAARAALPAAGGTVSGSNANATREFDEPGHGDVGGSLYFNSGASSVWWTWTAPEAGTASIDLAGTAFDALLAVYRGDSIGQLVPLAQNDDFGSSRQSRLSFAAAAGQTYQIAVDSRFSQTGAVTLRLTLDTSNADVLLRDGFE